MGAPKTTDPIFLRLIRHPSVWGGVGLLIRYYDDYSLSGAFWKTIGVGSLVWGAGRTVMTQEHDPYKQLEAK